MDNNQQPNKKDLILLTACDLAGSFLYYDRREDEELPKGTIQQCIKDGIVDVDEICDSFRSTLENLLKLK